MKRITDAPFSYHLESKVIYDMLWWALGTGLPESDNYSSNSKILKIEILFYEYLEILNVI
jgi:hypothetical protein